MTAIASIQALTITPPAQQKQATPLTPAEGSASSGGSTFGAILDTINPLQHIPIVSNLYRAATGTSISAVSQIAGDTLFGGLVGGAISSLVSSVADVAVKGVTGKGISEHVIDTVEAVGDPSTSASASTSTANSTLLVASPPSDVPSVTPDPTLVQKAEEASHIILRDQLHPERVAASYQRAQTLDIGNKLLIKSL
jgi:hypothetical protein